MPPRTCSPEATTTGRQEEPAGAGKEEGGSKEAAEEETAYAKRLQITLGRPVRELFKFQFGGEFAKEPAEGLVMNGLGR